jgi:Flp pilus assembly pilin Flp
MIPRMNALLRKEGGAGATEYIAITFFIAVSAICLASVFGLNGRELFAQAANALGGKTSSVTRAGFVDADSACFVAGTPVDSAEGSKAIEEVALGDRVGPESAECGALRLGDWREVGLLMAAEDGRAGAEEVHINLLRPPEWFAEHSVSLGSRVALSIEELNLRGEALVTGLREGPQLKPGSRCPAIGLMRRTSRQVVTVALRGGTALEVTRSHRLFSAGRQDWVAAGDLAAGENLVTRDGTAQVDRVIDGPREPTEVFNLEVIGEHRYFVGDRKVLAHNQCSPATHQPMGGGGRILRDGEGATAAEMAASAGGPTGGSRAGQAAARKKLIDDAAASGGPFKCWRCGETSTDPRDMHLGHRNTPTSKGGNLDPANIALEGAACNLSAGNRGAPKTGRSCWERGSCGAPFGR